MRILSRRGNDGRHRLRGLVRYTAETIYAIELPKRALSADELRAGDSDRQYRPVTGLLWRSPVRPEDGWVLLAAVSLTLFWLTAT